MSRRRRITAARVSDECAVRISDGQVTETKVGIRISEGPETYRLLLTRPADKEGLVEEIAVDSIEAVLEVEPGPRGEPPVIIEE